MKDTAKTTRGITRITMTLGNKVINFKFCPYNSGFLSERQVKVRRTWLVGKMRKAD